MSGPTNRNTIASALTTILQGIDGTGSYTYDLSGAGQVEQIDLAGPPVSRVRPYVAYYLGARQDIRGGAGADLSQYGQTMTVDLVGVVTGGTDPGAAVQAANNMEADIIRALHASRNLGAAAVHDLSVSTEVVTGPEVDGRQRDAYVAMTVELFWSRV
jgi:hypothetical protein